MPLLVEGRRTTFANRVHLLAELGYKVLQSIPNAERGVSYCGYDDPAIDLFSRDVVDGQAQ